MFTLEKIIAHLDDEGRALVTRAHDYALKMHGGQRRLSGDPYISHLLEVAGILSQYQLDAQTLAAAFLHDLIEEKTPAGLEDIRENFGDEIAALVDDVTKLTSLFSRQEREVRRSPSEAHIGKEAAIENLRRIFLAMARDLRVILIKLADRLHNLRTLEYTTPEVQASIAHETLDIFAPIASRLGIWEFKAEMEDLAFRYAYPQAYAKLSKEVEATKKKRMAVMRECLAAIHAKLDEMGVEAEVEHRDKHLYSIYKKIRRTGKTLNEVYDLMAIRVIVNTIEECYGIFGMIHSMWSPVNNRIKDYIARPKANNYRSLHTTVVGPKNQLVEIQIRTFEMHKVNEVGIAAHWAYKEGRKAGKDQNLFRDVYPWIRALLDWKSDARESEGYADHLKLKLLDQQIFVFTPKGDTIDLPAGSTPIDFAYRIHTDVGHRCVGARVNKKMVPLTYKLENADVVEIQTSKTGTPSRDWLRVCASHQALSKIRNWFKKERREENIARGKDMLKREAARLRREADITDEMLMKVAESLTFQSVDDLLASVGYSETTPAQIFGRIQSLKPPAPLEPVAASKQVKRTGPRREIVVSGSDNMLTKLARCCSPVPGDDIIGYISIGKGVSVHRRDCINMRNLESEHPERVIETIWNIDETQPQAQKHNAGFCVKAYDRSGLVADLLQVLNDMRVPVRSCSAKSQDGEADVRLEAEVFGKRQTEEIITKLKRVKNVYEVSRGVS